MAKQNINVGTKANDKAGDPLRTAFTKINDNFTELYTLTGGTSTALTELAQDYAAPLFNHASHTNITVTYDDANNKILLTGVAAQVQSNWTATTGLGVILNKPTIPAAQVNADWNSSSGVTQILNKPTIPTSFSSLVNGSHTLSLGSTGNTTFPTNISINYSGGNVLFPRIIADTGKAFSVQGQGNTGSTALAWTVDPDAASQYAAVSVSRAGGDNLAKVVLQAQSNSSDAGTAKTWRFNETGTLTLPAGGVIAEGGGISGAIKLTPAGGANAYQALLIYPTAGGEGDHIHLTAGGGTTELYLGNDTHYVKLGKGAGYNGTIIITATGRPNTVSGIISQSGNWAVVSLSNLATTGGTGTGLTVTVTQVAGVATAIAIVSGAMEGYTSGDTITVTSGAATATFIIGVLAPEWVFAPDGDLYIPSGNTIRKIGSGEDIRSIPGPYADDAAAAAASVAVGYPYHKTGTGGQVVVRLT